MSCFTVLPIMSSFCQSFGNHTFFEELCKWCANCNDVHQSVKIYIASLEDVNPELCPGQAEPWEEGASPRGAHSNADRLMMENTWRCMVATWVKEMTRSPRRGVGVPTIGKNGAAELSTGKTPPDQGCAPKRYALGERNPVWYLLHIMRDSLSLSRPVE